MNDGSEGRSPARTIGVMMLALGLLVACGSTRREGFQQPDGMLGDGGPNAVQATSDPENCEQAKSTNSYIGCDFWPTVTANTVQAIFDYVVVVANVGSNEAAVTVTGPNAVNRSVTVPAGSLKKIYLPWVDSLKASLETAPATTVVKGGAYHLVSSVPVVVYQFNPLEYKGEGGEDPNGGAKNWSNCKDPNGGKDCFSYSVDASLLLPSTAMTGNYRVTAMHGFDASNPTQEGLKAPGVLSITATQPGTIVSIELSARGGLRAGSPGNGVTETAVDGGGTLTVPLAGAGDVAQLVTQGENAFDFSGSVIHADKPVQVIASVPCIFLPDGVLACDHVEETVMPAETFGKHYVIGTPTGAKGKPAKQVVRMYGNRNDTHLTYSPAQPPSCPTLLQAGDIGDCGVLEQSFEVTADQDFGVATFLLGAAAYSDSAGYGDPSQTTHPAVEQYRTKYVFLAPNDYPVQWADVVGPEDAAIELDGQPASAAWTKIGAGPYGIRRLDLTKSGEDGVHRLSSSKGVGVQVIGYGQYTSFQYPAGLNLSLIAPPPGPR